MEDAFREACTALGETMVRERLLQRRLAAMERAMTNLEAAMKEAAPASDGDG
jgi:hypothetical protein